ncbi:LysR family transcriptional regulator [Shewanella psychropiezotolerans]|uniref:LysR family transcriptional regulator n=2 Tax=Shewanellaceae TaxID=267890 RepID=A0ABX5X6W4_9GAMM|nr:LysR family transcriptional regulator [Shewanella sp. YLB-07]QDO86673.1 LysR family transcriptional regulator [Shewanella psychropiezotolerans]
MEINWLSYLPLYIHLCEERSIAATAKRLDCSTAHVSRQLVKLETRVNKQLIHRTTRQFVVTADGQEFYRNAKALMDHAEEIESKICDSESTRGKIKISASASFGASRLSAIVAEFSKQHPQIELEILFTEQPIDLIEAGVDLAVYLTDTPAEGYVGHKLKPIVCAPYAHENYIKAHGNIHHPRELTTYNHIIYKSEILNLDNWQFVHAKTNEIYDAKLTGNFKTNMLPSMVEAMLAESGIAMLADFALDKLTENERSSIIRLLPEWATTGMLPLYILYPKRKHLPKRTSLLIEHLKDRLSKEQ